MTAIKQYHEAYASNDTALYLLSLLPFLRFRSTRFWRSLSGATLPKMA